MRLKWCKHATDFLHRVFQCIDRSKLWSEIESNAIKIEPIACPGAVGVSDVVYMSLSSVFHSLSIDAVPKPVPILPVGHAG